VHRGKGTHIILESSSGETAAEKTRSKKKPLLRGKMGSIILKGIVGAEEGPGKIGEGKQAERGGHS